jgi:hypothetical protein
MFAPVAKHLPHRKLRPPAIIIVNQGVHCTGSEYIQTVSLVVPDIRAPYIVLAPLLSKNLVDPGLSIVAYLVALPIEIQ